MSDTLSDIFQKGKKGKAAASTDGPEKDPAGTDAGEEKKSVAKEPETKTPPAAASSSGDAPKQKRGRKPGKKGVASYVSILHECETIANKRQNAYGEVTQNFADISNICKAMFGLEISPVGICQVMIATKYARQKTKKNRDNGIDATNYTAILTKLQND